MSEKIMNSLQEKIQKLCEEYNETALVICIDGIESYSNLDQSVSDFLRENDLYDKKRVCRYKATRIGDRVYSGTRLQRQNIGKSLKNTIQMEDSQYLIVLTARAVQCYRLQCPEDYVDWLHGKPYGVIYSLNDQLGTGASKREILRYDQFDLYVEEAIIDSLVEHDDNCRLSADTTPTLLSELICHQSTTPVKYQFDIKRGILVTIGATDIELRRQHFMRNKTVTVSAIVSCVYDRYHGEPEIEDLSNLYKVPTTLSGPGYVTSLAGLDNLCDPEEVSIIMDAGGVAIKIHYGPNTMHIKPLRFSEALRELGCVDFFSSKLTTPPAVIVAADNPGDPIPAVPDQLKVELTELSITVEVIFSGVTLRSNYWSNDHDFTIGDILEHAITNLNYGIFDPDNKVLVDGDTKLRNLNELRYQCIPGTVATIDYKEGKIYYSDPTGDAVISQQAPSTVEETTDDQALQKHTHLTSTNVLTTRSLLDTDRLSRWAHSTRLNCLGLHSTVRFMTGEHGLRDCAYNSVRLDRLGDTDQARVLLLQQGLSEYEDIGDANALDIASAILDRRSITINPNNSRPMESFQISVIDPEVGGSVFVDANTLTLYGLPDPWEFIAYMPWTSLTIKDAAVWVGFDQDSEVTKFLRTWIDQYGGQFGLLNSSCYRGWLLARTQ